jgi:hypothetical protein
MHGTDIKQAVYMSEENQENTLTRSPDKESVSGPLNVKRE